MITGSCLCGGVRYAIDGRVSPIQLCHCSKCRKSNGSAFHAGLACRSGKFRFTQGEQQITDYRSESGYGTRFCRVCGSPVPGDDGEYAAIPAGSLDGDPGARALRHIFVDSKAPWYEIGDALPRFAEHAPPDQQLSRKDRGP